MSPTVFFPRFTPATSLLALTCDLFVGGNCLRYDSRRNNFGFGITTLRLVSVAFSSYSAFNAGENIHTQSSLLLFLFFDPKRKAQANSLLELREVHQYNNNLFPFEDVLVQRNI